MNRFFSKLDLRDIKIDPNSSRFPPDAEDEPEYAEVQDNVDTPGGPVSDSASADFTDARSDQRSPHRVPARVPISPAAYRLRPLMGTAGKQRIDLPCP